MRSIVICVLCLQMVRGYDYPGTSRGVGAFSFSDSSGRKYGGTYDIKDGQIVSSRGNWPPAASYSPSTIYPPVNSYSPSTIYPPVDSYTSARNFPVPFADAYQPYGYGHPEFGYPADNFFSAYFGNLENYLQELQPFSDFSGFGGFRDIYNMPNGAFASASAGPGYSHQTAAINPPNPHIPNVNKVNQFSEIPSQGGFYSVSSKSYSSSTNVDGKEHNLRGAETVVNDNGKITKYKVGN